MKRILSSIGIGSAEVDLVLDDTTVTQGETVPAEVEVVGGSSEQDIDEIYYAIRTTYVTSDGRKTGSVAEGTLVEGFTIEADETRTIDIDMDIPHPTPVTMGKTNVWIDTGLDIDWAVDPDDRDELRVQPDERTRDLLEAMDDLGFTFREAKNVADEFGVLTQRQDFVQEFEFKPRAGDYVGDLDEVEIIAIPRIDEIEFIVEVDRATNALQEITGTDESVTTVTFDGVDAEDELAVKLRDAIDRYV